MTPVIDLQRPEGRMLNLELVRHNRRPALRVVFHNPVDSKARQLVYLITQDLDRPIYNIWLRSNDLRRNNTLLHVYSLMQESNGECWVRQGYNEFLSKTDRDGQDAVLYYWPEFCYLFAKYSGVEV